MCMYVLAWTLKVSLGDRFSPHFHFWKSDRRHCVWCHKARRVLPSPAFRSTNCSSHTRGWLHFLLLALLMPQHLEEQHVSTSPGRIFPLT